MERKREGMSEEKVSMTLEECLSDIIYQFYSEVLLKNKVKTST
jgi:hypothetical protein